MAGQDAVHLDFATFQKHANEYAAVIAPIDKAVDGLFAAVEDAKPKWEGSAQIAFEKAANRLQDRIREVNKDLGLVAEALMAGEKKVAAADDESMDGFTTLSTNYN
ncbi:WXG100 family type VII secretion target [Nocardia salmonicida]|uniref:WXG100 family type VII secretion target n=1 Tax=Nocardia salmonicida TaxID=53431 RepID=UPI0036704634